MKLEIEIKTLAIFVNISIILAAMVYIFKTKSEGFDVNNRETSPLNGDKSSFIHKKGIDSDHCKRIVDLARNMEFDTDAEPVDNEPLFQIDIYVDGEILNKKLWNQCKRIYRAYKEDTGSNDFMFVKRYNMSERTRLKAHSDSAKYTISVLLSSTDNFTGCEFFIFDKATTKSIAPDFYEMDSEGRDRYISSLGGKLPIVPFEEGDVIRFDSECLHGVTHLTGGERYLLTIFYGSYN